MLHHFLVCLVMVDPNISRLIWHQCPVKKGFEASLSSRESFIQFFAAGVQMQKLTWQGGSPSAD